MNVRILVLAALLFLSACGDSDRTGQPSSRLSGTLAYVESGCREDETSIHIDAQQLRVQVADGPAVVVREIAGFGPIVGDGTCLAIGLSRFGLFFLSFGAFQRLAVSPDGTFVIFEVTDEFGPPRPQPLTEEEKGFFVARADGSGLRRLAPASRERSYRNLLPEEGLLLQPFPDLAISPSGRSAVFTDRANGPIGETNQLFVMDMVSGERRQVTFLPRTAAFEDPGPPTCCASFQDEETLIFPTAASINGGPQGLKIATVRVDGSDLKEIALPQLFARPQLVPQFAITSAQRSTTLLVFGLGTPDVYREVFVSQDQNLLQLTNFGRFDTSDPLLSGDGSQVYFVASADPFGQNPKENCQVFSVDAFGGGLRQVSQFSEGEASENGCFFSAPDGCAVSFVGQDPRTGALILHSSCDPFGENVYGAQLFALAPTSGELRQLTNLSGLEIPDESHVMIRLPGPFAYSSLRR